MVLFLLFSRRAEGSIPLVMGKLAYLCFHSVPVLVPLLPFYLHIEEHQCLYLKKRCLKVINRVLWCQVASLRA